MTAAFRRTKRRMQTREQRKALALLTLLERAYLAASKSSRRDIGFNMREAAKNAHHIDAVRVWEVEEIK